MFEGKLCPEENGAGLIGVKSGMQNRRATHPDSWILYLGYQAPKFTTITSSSVRGWNSAMTSSHRERLNRP